MINGINILAKVKALVGALENNCGFYYGEKFEINATADNATLPITMLEMPILGRPRVLPQGNVEMTYDLDLYFLEKSELDDLQPDRRPGIDAANLAAREFIVRAQEDKDITEVEPVNLIELYNLFDVNVDGVYLKIKFKIKDKAAVCLTKWLVDHLGNYIVDKDGRKQKA